MPRPTPCWRAHGARASSCPRSVETIAMKEPLDQLYAERLHRYVTAMRNGMPDRVPLRPFAAEITARYAGYTCQDVTHDYNKAFEAVIQLLPRFRLGRRGAQHGLRVDRPDPGDRPALLRHPRHRRGSRRGLSVPRARRAGRLHEARGIRRADRRPGALPLRNLAAAGLHGGQRPRASPRRTATTSRS